MDAKNNHPAFFKKKIFTPFVALLLVLASAGVTLGVVFFPQPAPVQPAPSIEELYAAATKDAMTVEPEEVLPVLTLNPGDPQTTWNQEGKVLLLSWHRYPDSYPAGQEVTLEWDDVWCFTDQEIADWYVSNRDGVTDWTLRLEQLIGLPPDKGYTHFTAMWASPEDIVRPAYVSDIALSQMVDAFSEDVDPEFHAWFDDNIIWSYYHSQYPWTRLGYTYDWADNGAEYGLSEFLVKKGAKVDVEFTYTTEEFLDWLGKQ